MLSRTHHFPRNGRRITSRKRQETAAPRHLETLEQRQLLAAVVATSPNNFALGAGVHSHVEVVFSSAMISSTINSSTFRLLDASNNVIAGRISYNSVNFKATFDSTATLNYGATYHAIVTGGAAGVKDSGNGVLAADVSWSFTTAVNPTTGTGGPILVVTSSTNPYSTYYPEILRAEGLTQFATADINTVSSTSLATYTVVILGEMTLTTGQVTTLTNWVNGGGNLIAMRPDKKLASLLGLTDAATTISNTYLQVNTTTSPGAGITAATMQYHGTADRYTLNGATAVATLFSNATSALVNPAVTIRNVGSNGGQAAAFTYDLAKSVVQTRQGNPAWSGQERDNDPILAIRSDDLFFGNSPTDPQPDWVDLNKVAIPQADEQQRLFANMITSMNMDKMPLPRLWYLPDGAKAVLVMTGDDHWGAPSSGAVNTPDYFDLFNNSGTSGGQSIRGTSYLVDNAGITDAEAAQFAAQGFELALHVEVVDGNHVVRNWVSMADLQSLYAAQKANFIARYPSLALPETIRTHGIVWSDYDSQPQVEFINGIRLDTNYYYWPGSWATSPGLFTGSGLPQRFTKADGTMIDVYQATTQLVDENSATVWPGWVNFLLDNAQGANGYYGAFVINDHTDNPNLGTAQAIINAAKAHNVKIITAESLLDFTDGRNGTQFSSLSWNNTLKTLGFSLAAGSGATGLQAMVPVASTGNLRLSALTRSGNAVTFTVQSIKGVDYAFFNAVDGSYVATYAADTTAPTVESRTPAINATDVAITNAITVTFSESINPATLSMTLKIGATTIASTVTYNAASRTATLVPNSYLAFSTTYTVTVSAQDTSANTLAATSWTFTTAASSSLWNNSPTPVNPAVSDGSPIEVGTKFQSSVNGFVTGLRFYKGASNTGAHVGHLWSSSGTLLGTVNFGSESASGWQTASFSAPISIAAGQTYVMSYYSPSGFFALDVGYFSANVVSGPLTAPATGNGVFFYGAGGGFPNLTAGGNNYWVDPVFTTLVAADTTPPTIVNRSPVSGATDVALNAPITITFNESLNAATVNGTNITLKLGATTIAATVTYNAATFTATLTPTSALAINSTYTVSVSNVADTAGNVMPTNSWSFTTVVSNNVSIWAPSATPAVAADTDGQPIEVGVKFRSSVSGYVTAVRFYKGTANTGTHVGHLWSSTGTLLATVTFSGESASGWQQMNLSNAVAITANTTYIVSYYSASGFFAINGGYFASSGVTNGPLTALANGVDGGNGVFRVGSGGGFPNTSFNSGNYWVDVVFTTTAPVDNTAPTIVDRSPGVGATGVAINSPVTITFSEPLNAATVNGTNITLKQGATTITATVTYNAATLTATLTPTAALALNTIYTVTVNGVADTSGNAMSSTNWTFTTAASNNVSIWAPSATPAIAADTDGQPVEIGVKFRSSVSGYVTAVRFYKGTANTGTHVGHLWSSTGTLLATVTFSGESASGWQQMNLSNAVAITANTTYIVSYYSPSGFFAINGGYFASSGVTNGPLTALANGVDGGNGVFRFGSGGGFPNTSFNSGNYWVDVVFTTTVPADTSAPSISARTPSSGATGVATSSAVSITFDEALNVATVNGTNITLKLGATTISGTVTFNATTRTATLTPSAALSLNSVYTVTVNGVADTAGNAMSSTSWNFTTAATNVVSVWQDSVTPAVAADSDGAPIEVGMKFRSSVSGYVLGVQFYKGAPNTGTHVGKLYNAAGTLLASVTFTNESASGWQTATFSNPVAINANTTYVVSYYSPSGFFAIDSNYFSAGGASSGPLTALANGVDGQNGVFFYGAGGGFPNQSFANSNYWVDVLFTATAPLAVVARTPAPAATAVPRTTTVTVTFNTAINPASLSLVLRNAANQVIASTVVYDPVTLTATLTPSSQLAAGSVFTTTLNATDPLGNALSPVIWSFTTV